MTSLHPRNWQKGRAPKPMPEDFPTRAPYVSLAWAKRNPTWATKRGTLRRWELEAGVTIGSHASPFQYTAHNRGAARPCPPDFAEYAPSLYMTEALDRWQTTWRIIYRWEKQTGVKCRRAAAGHVIDSDRARALRAERQAASRISLVRDELGVSLDLYRLAMGPWSRAGSRVTQEDYA